MRMGLDISSEAIRKACSESCLVLWWSCYGEVRCAPVAKYRKCKRNYHIIGKSSATMVTANGLLLLLVMDFKIVFIVWLSINLIVSWIKNIWTILNTHGKNFFTRFGVHLTRKLFKRKKLIFRVGNSIDWNHLYEQHNESTPSRGK